MNRATVVYIVMLVACGVGVWLILRAGSHLRAPVDLSGAWRVGGEDPAVVAVLGDELNIEQSGRFVRLNFSRGLRADVKLIDDDAAPDASSSRRLDMLFQGPTWKLSAFGASADGPLILRMTGPGSERHTFTITRGATAGDDDKADSSPAVSPTETAAVAGTNAP